MVYVNSIILIKQKEVNVIVSNEKEIMSYFPPPNPLKGVFATDQSIRQLLKVPFRGFRGKIKENTTLFHSKNLSSIKKDDVYDKFIRVWNGSIFWALSVLMFCCSCSKEVNTSGKILFVDLENYQEAEMGDYCDRIELIPLETNSKSLLSGSRLPLLVCKEHFYVHDGKQNCIVVFNKRGEMVTSTVSNNGQGPNQYYNCGHMGVDCETGDIQILDQVKRVIYQYDLQGRLVNHVKLPNHIVRIRSFFKITDNRYVIYLDENEPEGTDKRLLIYSADDGKIVADESFMTDRYLHFTTNCVMFQRLNDTIVFTPDHPTYTSFMMVDGGNDLELRRRLDFGKFNIDPTSLPLAKEKHNSWFKTMPDFGVVPFDRVENGRYIVMVLYKGRDSYIVVVDKQRGKTLVRKNNKVGVGQLWGISAIDDHCLYYLCPPEYLKYVTCEQLMDHQGQKLVEGIKEEDNPVIVKYYLKNGQ